MRIIFGWNYIVLKSYRLKDLIVTNDESLKNAELVVREAYFHLFWIPFFSLGRRYHLKPDNLTKRYLKPSADLMRQLDKKQLKVKKKWYAWILTLLIGLGLVFLGVSWMIADHSKNDFVRRVNQEINEFLANPEKGDRFSLATDASSINCEVHKVEKKDLWLTVDYSKYTRYKLRMTSNSKPAEESMAFNDSLDKIEYTQKKLAKRSVFIDSLRSVYPDELLLQELVAFDLENVPKTYSIIKLPRKEFETLKFASVAAGNSVFLPSLKHITGSKVRISMMD